MDNYLKKLKERVLKRKKIDKNNKNVTFIFFGCGFCMLEQKTWSCFLELFLSGAEKSLYVCIQILCSLFVYENRAVFLSGEIKKPTKIN